MDAIVCDANKKSVFLFVLQILLLGFWPYELYAETRFYGTLEAGYGALRGYIQTPKGGNIGTTSFERPTFSELNHHQDHFFQGSLGYHYKSYFIEGNYLNLHPQAHGVLNTDLITHGKFIPHQTLLNINVKFNWETLAIGKMLNMLSPSWCIIPRVEGNLMHYHYQCWTPKVQSRRAFNLATLGVGVDVVKTFCDDWTLFLQARCDIPITHFHYVKANIGIQYMLWRTSKITISPYLKIGIIQLDYEDTQTVSNHLRYTNFPWIAVGLWVGSL